jgi:hypothetical protein
MAIEVIESELWRPGTGQDPAKYLVKPGQITGRNKHSPGNLGHSRPYIVSGNVIFAFPVGVEGFTRSGSAQLGLHRYLGENAVRGNVTHREEARIELTGTFPGLSAQDLMVSCINILRSAPPKPGLILYAPGVFNAEQYVLPEQWNFTHDPEDRTHSINYTISFVRTGEGQTVKDPIGKAPDAQPGVKTVPRGQPIRSFTVTDGARTLRQIAYIVYHNAEKWQELVQLNAGTLATFQRSQALNEANDLPSWKLPTYRWPIGTQFRY